MKLSRRQLLQASAISLSASAEATYLDLSNAEIVFPPNASGRVRNYAAMFSDESQKRCRVLWKPGSGPTKIRLEISASRNDEGFEITLSNSEVRVTGNSERGLLFGIGKLLRSLEYYPQHMRLPIGRARVSSAPIYPLRGHQLGYRPKTNSYDGWNVADWHQYIRDLAVFGVNTIEILPPRTDDDASSPHFPLPPEQMMVEVSRLADLYGLDVWMWFPAMADNYSDSNAVRKSLQEWAAVFEKLPKLDAVFTPGGDPGDTPPDILLALLEKQKTNLRRYHPNAQMWVSPQSLGQTQLEEFYQLANAASWLDGVTHGPQCRCSLPELRQKLRKSLPIRLYPDITHSLQCQFPVPDWDRAFAATEGRECINPRPEGQAAIARQYLPGTRGFIAYSEGCNDDVNKFIWSSAAWDPSFSVDQSLLEYARYFIGDQAVDFAAGIKALEKNWVGAAVGSETVEQTLLHFQKLEKQATPATLRNWRFQQALYRAYFDGYSRRRLLGVADEGLRTRILELGEALFQSIHMQLDVTHYQAESVARGANLATLDASLTGPAEARPEGLYDDLGDPQNRPHLAIELVNQTKGEPDPEFRQSVLIGFLYPDSLGDRYPVAWKRWGETLFDTAIRLRYTQLDSSASYKIRVVYSGDAHDIRVRLTANGAEIHPLMRKPWPPKPLEFDVPRAVTAGGSAVFSWTRELGLGGSGRGCQISEVWLIRR